MVNAALFFSKKDEDKKRNKRFIKDHYCYWKMHVSFRSKVHYVLSLKSFLISLMFVERKYIKPINEEHEHNYEDKNFKINYLDKIVGAI